MSQIPTEQVDWSNKTYYFSYILLSIIIKNKKNIKSSYKIDNILKTGILWLFHTLIFWYHTILPNKLLFLRLLHIVYFLFISLVIYVFFVKLLELSILFLLYFYIEY
jgi:hypothetical protein